MTTPAINKAVTATSQSSYTSGSDVSSPSTTFLGNAITYWDEEYRPASSNGPRSGGFLLCKPWTHTGRQWSVEGGSAYMMRKTAPHSWRYYPEQSFWVSSGNEMSPPLPGTPSQNFINSVEVKALNKLKNQNVHLGNFLAEGRRTIKMVMGTARRIAKQIEAYRRKSPAGWTQVKQYQRGNLPRSKWICIPNAWLELQYGWTPLLSDITGAMIHLYRRSRFEIPYVTVKSGGTQEEIKTSMVYGNQFSASYKQIFKVQHRVGIVLVYGNNLPHLAELSSLGLINPLEIVWELVPYSFIVDWFLPIGPWLSAITADVGYQFITGTKSIKTSMTYDGPAELSYNPTGYDVTIVPSGLSGKTENFGRSCYAASPVPGLYVKNPLSKYHIANAIALIGQAIGRK